MEHGCRHCQRLAHCSGECVAVCCAVLQCDAMCCAVVAVCRAVLKCVAEFCNENLGSVDETQGFFDGICGSVN